MSKSARSAIRTLARATRQAQSQEIRKLAEPGQFLHESGLLFEINRRVLHPLGMALEVEVGGPAGTSRVGGVWDYRDDPEGIRFGDDEFTAGLQRLGKFMDDFGKRKLAERQKVLGFVVQGEST